MLRTWAKWEAGLQVHSRDPDIKLNAYIILFVDRKYQLAFESKDLSENGPAIAMEPKHGRPSSRALRRWARNYGTRTAR